jgi:hypothetical protein
MSGSNFKHGLVDENPDVGKRNTTANRVRAILDDKTPTLDVKKTPEQLFDEKIMPKIHDMVMAFGLIPVIEKCRGILSGETEGSSANRERKVIEIFMRAFNKKQLPFKKWAFFPEVIISEGTADISGAALIFGAIMNQEFGIKISLTQSDDDQVSVVTYDDERIEYVDFRNELIGKPESPDAKVKIVMGKNDDVRLHSLPTSEFKRGVMMALSENIQALRDQQGSDAKANETLSRYAESLDKYAKNDF